MPVAASTCRYNACELNRSARLQSVSLGPRASVRCDTTGPSRCFNIDRSETKSLFSDLLDRMISSLRKSQRYSLLWLFCALACFTANSGYAEVASVYGGADGHCGSRTANGERVNCAEMTAAHRTLPLAQWSRSVTTVAWSCGSTIAVRLSADGKSI
jgi:rare lipoprotein A (peptidoglycan hydrolase)